MLHKSSKGWISLDPFIS